MAQRRVALTDAEKALIARGKAQAKTDGALGEQLHCSSACIHKWAGRLRAAGQAGLQAGRMGRPARGSLSSFTDSVRQRALRLKQQHPGWGAQRVLVSLRTEPALATQKLPSASSLARYFKQHCPDCLQARVRHPKQSVSVCLPAAVHALWQLDMQENFRLADGDIATVCNIRDPFGAAMIASQAFSVKVGSHYRKLHVAELRQILRAAFSEWHTLPDALQTDNELNLVGQMDDPFPGVLTLWLVGLGVSHRCIRPGRPTEQGAVERQHRTLQNWTDDQESLANLVALQYALDQQRTVYNLSYPAQARNCAGQPPLQAHPELLQPRRRYNPACEHQLFNYAQVYAYLAALRLERQVSASGQVRLGSHLYWVGRQHRGQRLRIRFEATLQQWVFYAAESVEDAREVQRQAARGLEFETLTGLSPQPPATTLCDC